MEAEAKEAEKTITLFVDLKECIQIKPIKKFIVPINMTFRTNKYFFVFFQNRVFGETHFKEI